MGARKTLVLMTVVAMAGVMVSSADAAGRKRLAQRGEGMGLTIPIQAEPLTEQEVLDLTYMREEEKLARDVYLAMDELWAAGPFAKIADSEQRHMDALYGQVVLYDVVDPIVDNTPGVFANEDLAALYTELVDAGSVSYVDALMVGAMIEELDIVDLREALLSVEHATLTRVYENLLRGSRNHLRSFAWFLTQEGATYEAQYLSQEEFDEIAASAIEQGTQRRYRGGFGHGQGNGTGQGGQGNGDGTGQGGNGHGNGDGTGQGGQGNGDCDGTGQGGGNGGGGNGGGNGDGSCLNG